MAPTVLVTGAAGNLGKAVALAMPRHDFRVGDVENLAELERNGLFRVLQASSEVFCPLFVTATL